MGSPSRAVFIDRDGTINEEMGYINHVDRFTLLPRTAKAIRLINANGLKAVVVTNQSGVARGMFPESLVGAIHQRMEELLRADGAHIDGIYYCPHHPDFGTPEYRKRCHCRKPATGMIERACSELGIDPKRSYMIGDRIIDVEFGHKIGTKGILVLTGYGKGELTYCNGQWKEKPDFIAQDLYDAVRWIVAQET
ncbi:MAG: HAD family hydrolase [Syntrophobacterales bacterium]|nr:MAG: HAD family hydrolase [Syntrophobacterales bacterium]